MALKGSGSDVTSSFITAAAADPNGISTAATIGSATNLSINGALHSGGSVTMDSPRNVTILSAGDDSGITFTVTGTDESNDAQTEVITGANAGTATGSSFFKTVTQIATSAASAGNVSAGSGTSCSGVISVARCRLRGIYVVNGSGAATIVFREGSGTGTIRMQFATVAGASTNSYPDVPDDGLLFVGGGFVTFTAVTDLTAMTTFFS
jgi:hypothetical protein|tara:strand:- start:314 stop:937 length:624 start_codon:yes stop_codon:yes gene_type:complete